MRVCTPITIRYGETDMMGVVYHANYLLYFEDARIDFLDAAVFLPTEPTIYKWEVSSLSKS